MGGCPQPRKGIFPCQGVTRMPTRSASLVEMHASVQTRMWLPLVGLALGIALGLVLNVNVSPDLARYSAVAILAGLDSVLGAIRAELDAHYDNRIFLSGFVTNALVAVALTFVGDRLGIDLYLVALFAFGLRIFQNVALIRRHFL
jgi:small basic protein